MNDTKQLSTLPGLPSSSSSTRENIVEGLLTPSTNLYVSKSFIYSLEGNPSIPPQIARKPDHNKTSLASCLQWKKQGQGGIYYTQHNKAPPRLSIGGSVDEFLRRHM